MTELIDRAGTEHWNYWRITRWGAALALLLTPLVMMRISDQWHWTIGSFVFAGIIIGGVGLLYELAERASGSRAYRVGVAVALVASFLTVWTTIVRDDGTGMGYFMVILAGVGWRLFRLVSPRRHGADHVGPRGTARLARPRHRDRAVYGDSAGRPFQGRDVQRLLRRAVAYQRDPLPRRCQSGPQSWCGGVGVNASSVSACFNRRDWKDRVPTAVRERPAPAPAPRRLRLPAAFAAPSPSAAPSPAMSATHHKRGRNR